MNLPSSQVHDAALALPVPQRAELAYELLQSLKPPAGSSEDSSDFENELERRVQAYDAGESSATDWDTVSARLRQKLADRKSP
jgi:putative addiction module component (TIGR02574 family)